MTTTLTMPESLEVEQDTNVDQGTGELDPGEQDTVEQNAGEPSAGDQAQTKTIETDEAEASSVDVESPDRQDDKPDDGKAAEEEPESLDPELYQMQKDLGCQIWNQELKIKEAEADLEEAKGDMKAAKSRLENRIDHLRELCNKFSGLKKDENRPLFNPENIQGDENGETEPGKDGDNSTEVESESTEVESESTEVESEVESERIAQRVKLRSDVEDFGKTGDEYDVHHIDDDGDIWVMLPDEIDDEGAEPVLLEYDEYDVIQWSEVPASESSPAEDSSPKSYSMDDQWKTVTLVSIDCPSLELLLEADITTVGEMSEFTSKKELTDIKGIGPGKATKIDECLERFWESRK